MRSPLLLLSSAVALALTAAPAVAQERATTESAPAASAPQDCSGASVKRHDHGAERNAPSPKAMPCAPADAASGAKAKAKPTHDHAKVHKTM